MNYANASCTFDAVEPGAAPQTRLFTKLSGTAFGVDVLALSNATTINTSFTGSVDVDLVDASATACPTGTGLGSATTLAFVSGNAGRKNLSFNYSGVAPNVRVRMKQGASAPACSTDNFAIRPSAAQIVTTANAVAPSATAAIKFKAGSNFQLSATTSPGSYSGTWAFDSSKLSAQTTTQDSTVASGGTVGSLTPTSLVANDAAVTATYSEVGYAYLAPGAFIDTSFTAVDRANGDCISNTVGDANLSDTLSGGKYGCDIGNRTTVSLGRFYPDHLVVSAPSVTPFCAAVPANDFTYFGQDGFATNFTVTAQNAANATTQNYRGVYAKLTPTSYASYAFTTPSTLPTGSALAASTTVPTGSWVDGVVSVVARHQVSRPDNPSVETQITVNATPTDGEASAPMTAVGTAVRLRYGRLRMQNAYGSELIDLPVPFEAQYWNGTYYVTNTGDSCTVLPMSSLVMTYNPATLATLDPCKTQVMPTGNPTLAGGKLPGGLKLTKPGKGHSGSVDLAFNVTNAPVAGAITCVGPASSAATAANLPWFGPNIKGRATFGIYRSPLIYLRENY